MKQKKAPSRPPAVARKPMIFVVDDEPMLLELATVILEPLGYSVNTFRNPDAAIQAFSDARPRPALLITDYAMHLMNGMDLLRACRKVQPRQKILLVSGTVGEEVFKTSPCKPDAFLPKPYYAKQLLDTVQVLMADSRRV